MCVTSLHICVVKANISYQTDKDFLASIMPRDAVSRTTNVERNGGHKWVNWASMMPRDASLIVEDFSCLGIQK